MEQKIEKTTGAKADADLSKKGMKITAIMDPDFRTSG